MTEPGYLSIDPTNPIPNDGRLDDTAHPPAPPVAEADDAGCHCADEEVDA